MLMQLRLIAQAVGSAQAAHRAKMGLPPLPPPPPQTRKEKFYDFLFTALCHAPYIAVGAAFILAMYVIVKIALHMQGFEFP